MAKYTVNRRHLGDKMYQPGDEREARESDVAHLLARGVLSEVKAETKLRNKAEKPVLNKKAD